ncbi:hypothetical protein AB6A40_003413 [Gnathostoma spinigerum]|uniref:Uncharacterized protein n=1 Tax=Gnathostoma spinigerum TaxID=75299 RepID=A0ABD6EF10_9BILA
MGLDTRGRSIPSRGSKRPAVLPNLAVAGKRENKIGAVSSSKRGFKPSRDRVRGVRGRAKGGGIARPAVIEQTGIFSSGLNDDGRHDRAKADADNEFGVINLGRSIAGGIKGKDEVSMDLDSSFVAPSFESEWLSDEEADNTEMTDLLKYGFIADLKKGDVIPYVLPPSDEPQFASLIRDKVKKEEMLDEEYDIVEENRPETNNKPTRRRIESTEESGSEEKPSSVPSLPSQATETGQNVGAVIQRISSSSDTESNLLLLQLPTTLPVLCKSTVESKPDVMEGPSNTDEKNDEGSSMKPHCLDAFPAGSHLGRLRIRKSGRTELVINGVKLDALPAICEAHNDSVVLIHSEQPDRINSSHMTNANWLKNSLYVLGRMKDVLVFSHDFSNLVGGIEEEVKCPSDSDEKNGDSASIIASSDEKDSEMITMLDELAKLKMRESSWKAFINTHAVVIDTCVAASTL